MEKQHPLTDLMGTAMEKIRTMVDANTIVGNPINTPDGTLVLPISKISFGFASGGSDFPSKTNAQLFGGGGGGWGGNLRPDLGDDLARHRAFEPLAHSRA